MSVLVYIDHQDGEFKKKSFEAIHYGAKIANQTNTNVTAVTFGSHSDEELKALGLYGAQKVIQLEGEAGDVFDAKLYSNELLSVIEKEGAEVIVTTYDNQGKSIAGMIAAKLKAGLVSGAVDYPNMENGFVVKKTVFSGKAFAHVKVNTDKKVISFMPNTFQIEKNGADAAVEKQAISGTNNTKSLEKNTVAKGEIPLSEAERVVSGGRGLKGPENWGILEDLASELDAALACSRPVGDAGWRPHHEHVGQTGGTIRPNLYIAVGISGAIQHLAGVNSSKTIVVINQDAEAPFFKAADYGIVGDAFEIVPKLTEAVKKFKANQN